MSCYQDLVKGILAEARIHKYTYTNHKLNALNIKYYNFDSKFDSIEFCSEKSIRRCGSESLDDTRATPCSTVPPSEAVNAYRSPSTGPTVESGPLTGNRPRHHGKGEKNYTCTN
jgi:hypothetical protein